MSEYSIGGIGMKIEDIKKAVLEAERFIESAKFALDEQENAPLEKPCAWQKTGKELVSPYQYSIDKGCLHGGKYSADVQRKSMDLTRQLAKMRKGE